MTLAEDPRRSAVLQSLGLQNDAEADVSAADTTHDGFGALAESAAQSTGFPIALIQLIGDERTWSLASIGLDLAMRQRPNAPTLPFCRLAMQGVGLLEVADATHDERFAGTELALRACAAMPLLLDGVAIGTLCVADREPRALPVGGRESIQRLARIAVSMLRDRQRLVTVDLERTRLIDLARSSGDWMWETDAALRYTWVSDGFERFTGMPASQMRGQPIHDAPLLGERGQPLGHDLTFHALLNRRRPLARVVTEEPTPNGPLQVSRSAVPVFDTRGRFVGYRGTARDVSMQAAAERQTYAQAELLRKLSMQVPGVIFQQRMFDDGRVEYLYASDACREMFGTEPPRNGDGGDPMALCRLMDPDDQPVFLRAMIEAGRELRPFQREARIMRRGQVRWLDIRAVPEPHPDGGVLWHGFTADVTQRKETELALRSSEERWSLAADAAGIGTLQLAWPSGRLSLDARSCLNHGLPHPHPPITLDDWMARVHPDDRATVEQQVRTALAGGSPLEARFRTLHPDGDTRTLEIFARCTRDSHGHVTGLVGTCRDVTQQIALDQLRSEKETAERANRAKSEFLSRVSHELRTPLNGILGFAQLMALDRSHPLEADQSRRLDNVLRAGRHLLDLINDVLNLARIEHEDFSLQRVPVNLSASIESTVGLLQPQADAAGVKLVVPTRGAWWVEADARAIEQVLMNLVSNAIKYNRPQGTVRLALKEGGRGVEVSVSDEGAGFSAAQQALLFQPFHRFGAERRQIEGSGLGLVIARELALAMQGELRVDTTPGAGSTFTMSLPAGAAPLRGSQPAPAFPQSVMPATATSEQRQVLYIEDEPLNVLLMQEVFKARPAWRLRIATNGEDGLSLAALHAHDLLLVDMNLPDMNGQQLIRRLRADPALAGLRCIALSADAMQSQIDAALAAGYDDYWTKPINVARILNSLAMVLPR